MTKKIEQGYTWGTVIAVGVKFSLGKSLNSL